MNKTAEQQYIEYAIKEQLRNKMVKTEYISMFLKMFKNGAEYTEMADKGLPVIKVMLDGKLTILSHAITLFFLKLENKIYLTSTQSTSNMKAFKDMNGSEQQSLYRADKDLYNQLRNEAKRA